MRKYLSIVAVFIGILFAFAQVPEKMTYQSVIRNASGQLLKNQNVAVKVSVLLNSVSGVVVYSERLTGTTNANGLLSMEIGSGTVLSGTFNTINWSSGNYWLKTETDPTGGTNYTISGASQLLSIPYAMYAKSSGSTATIMRTDVLSIGPFSFVSPGNNHNVNTLKAYFPTSMSGATLVAPVNLPNGSVISQIKVHFLDNNYTKDYTFGLTRVPQGLNVFPETIASATSNTANTAIQTHVLNIPSQITINNSNYFYTISMYGDFVNTYEGICGAQITYSYPVNN